jgi:hypothetical protein
MKFFKVYIFLLSFLYEIKASGQKAQLDFNLVTEASGITLGTINGITQNKWGYIWFGDQTPGTNISTHYLHK